MFKDLLKDVISIKSISTDERFKDEIKKAAEWFGERFKDKGFEVKIFTEYGNPIVWSRYIVDESLPTCLIYGHYDVQPADLKDGWQSDPFTLTERDGRIYARGAVDNKGQIVAVVSAIFELISSGNLGYNVVFIVEGEEEVGSVGMEKFIRENKDLLKADFAYLSDGEMLPDLQPVIEAGFRGGFNAEVILKTADVDVHSGIYGTGVPNAIYEMSKLISSIYDNENRITIPHFYDDVDEITDDILENNKNISFSYEEYVKNTGAKKVLTEPGYDFYTQTGLRPSVQISGISGGYEGEGFKNIIPHMAVCKVNFRLVKSQNPQKIAKLFEGYIKSAVPDYVDVEVKIFDPYEGVKLDLSSDYVKKAFDVLEKVYTKKPVYKFCGGGLPIVTFFSEILNLPTLSIPLANEDCRMHAVDENFDLRYAEKGLEFCSQFFKK